MDDDRSNIKYSIIVSLSSNTRPYFLSIDDGGSRVTSTIHSKGAGSNCPFCPRVSFPHSSIFSNLFGDSFNDLRAVCIMLLGCCLRRCEHLACFQTPTEQTCFPQLWRICSKSFISRGRKGKIPRQSGRSSLSTDCKSRHLRRQNFIVVSCLLSILCSGSSGIKLFRSSTCSIRALSLSPSLFVLHLSHPDYTTETSL